MCVCVRAYAPLLHGSSFRRLFQHFNAIKRAIPGRVGSLRRSRHLASPILVPRDEIDRASSPRQLSLISLHLGFPEGGFHGVHQRRTLPTGV